VPSNFPDLTYDISTNPPTEKGFEPKLFYDGRLASDGLVSCGFCHLQENAFTHHGHTVSHGVDNALGKQKCTCYSKYGFSTYFMYDGAVSHLDLIIPLTR
jgi:cytochrome c peroxidase